MFLDIMNNATQFAYNMVADNRWNSTEANHYIRETYRAFEHLISKDL